MMVFFFWCCVFFTIVGAVGVVGLRHLLHAGLALGVALLGTAGLYLCLQAEYLAVLQVLVYVGGVLVLVLLGVFLSKDLAGRLQRTGSWGWLGALTIAGLVGQVALRLMAHGQPAGGSGLFAHPAVDAIAAAAPAGAVAMGDRLLGPWLVPFLAFGLLLTVVAVAAVALVRISRAVASRSSSTVLPSVPSSVPASLPSQEAFRG
jgi:NADH-quinone oxidoreductase subunit J